MTLKPLVKTRPTHQNLSAHPCGRQRIAGEIDPLANRSLADRSILSQSFQIHPLPIQFDFDFRAQYLPFFI